MRLMYAVITIFGLAFGLQAQTTAPIEVVNGAIAAVNDLGKEVVLGKYKTAMDRMYPQWKKRLAEQAGGEKELAKQFESLTAEMVKHGTSMISFRTYGFPKVFEAFPGKKVSVVDGKQVETLINTKWLLFIPTETRYRVMLQGDSLVIESKSYQVAIADKDKLVWSFIDGADLKVQDLRSMFISLPRDLELPEIKLREVPKEELQRRK